MWWWRRMEKISWPDNVRSEEVLLRVKEQRNILHKIRKRQQTGLVTFCVETAFYNGLLKERYKGE
jgi:phosphoribosyl-dephospho-CoA transferase